MSQEDKFNTLDVCYTDTLNKFKYMKHFSRYIKLHSTDTGIYMVRDILVPSGANFNLYYDNGSCIEGNTPNETFRIDDKIGVGLYKGQTLINRINYDITNSKAIGPHRVVVNNTSENLKVGIIPEKLTDDRVFWFEIMGRNGHAWRYNG